MNERIKQMWTKVCQDEMPELDETCMTLQRQEKFAELIVEDCFRVALVEGKGYLDPIKLRDAMKKHFGVEE